MVKQDRVDRLKSPLLREAFKEKGIALLQEKLGMSNRHQVPHIVKIVVNAGIGEASADPKVVDEAMRDLSLITGQKPQLRRAKKAIAAFKIRKGHPVGVKVTLRRNRCYHFMERLVFIVLPRVRDFRGLSKAAFDGRGNYNFGLREQTLFPEVNPDKVERMFGMDIAIVTSAHTDQEAEELLRFMGFPLQ